MGLGRSVSSDREESGCVVGNEEIADRIVVLKALSHVRVLFAEQGVCDGCMVEASVLGRELEGRGGCLERKFVCEFACFGEEGLEVFQVRVSPGCEGSRIFEDRQDAYLH